jgi:hypothetical protein
VSGVCHSDASRLKRDLTANTIIWDVCSVRVSLTGTGSEGREPHPTLAPRSGMRRMVGHAVADSRVDGCS